MRRFLDRLGATVSYQPQQRYVVITAEDRRTIVFTLGDTAYTVAGVRAQAPFAPLADGDDVVLPFFALARALYVEPVAQPNETVLQPRIGALDVRTDAGRTTITVRGAMPLLIATTGESPERLQLAFTGLGSALATGRRAAGAAVDGIDVAVGGSTKVPTTTITFDGARGSTHRVAALGLARRLHGRVRSAGAAGIPKARTHRRSFRRSTPPIVAGRATVTDLAIEPGADDALTVRITLSGAASYEWHRLADNRWYLDSPDHDARPDPAATSARGSAPCSRCASGRPVRAMRPRCASRSPRPASRASIWRRARPVS